MKNAGLTLNQAGVSVYQRRDVKILSNSRPMKLGFSDKASSRKKTRFHVALWVGIGITPLTWQTPLVVTHHPFDLPPHKDNDDIVDRAPMAMEVFARCGVDLLLAGHLHTSHTHNTSERYEIDGYAALVVQAGTATSTRSRGETNSFNVLRVQHDEIQVERYSWIEGTGFTLAATDVFRRQGDIWHPAA